jgi:hypothetical protein
MDWLTQYRQGIEAILLLRKNSVKNMAYLKEIVKDNEIMKLKASAYKVME